MAYTSVVRYGPPEEPGLGLFGVSLGDIWSGVKKLAGVVGIGGQSDADRFRIADQVAADAALQGPESTAAINLRCLAGDQEAVAAATTLGLIKPGAVCGFPTAPARAYAWRKWAELRAQWALSPPPPKPGAGPGAVLAGIPAWGWGLGALALVLAFRRPRRAYASNPRHRRRRRRRR